MGFKRQITTALTVALLCGSSLVQAVDVDEQIKELSEQAVAAYNAEKFDDASQKLQQVLALQPTSQQALNLREEIGFSEFLKMSKAEELQRVIGEILKLAKVGERAVLRDEDNIQAMIEALPESYETRWVRWGEDADPAIGAIPALGNAGQFAIAPLFKAVASEASSANMPYYTRALIAAGPDAVWPVIEASYSENETIANTALYVLGEYKSLVAVPRLLEVGATGNASRKRIVGEALAKIRQYNEVADVDAEKSYAKLIVDYLFGARGRDAALISDGHLWSLNEEGELVSRRVPKMAYKNALAEKLATQAIANKLGPKYTALLTLIKLAQLKEAQAFLAVDTDKEFSGNEELGAELKEFYTTQADMLKAVPSYMRVCGQDILLQALEIALANKQLELSMDVLDALAQVGRASLTHQQLYTQEVAEEFETPTESREWYAENSAGAPLNRVIAALDDENIAISARAAIALLATGPQYYFPGSDKVAPLIARAAASGDVGLLSSLCVGVARSGLVGPVDFSGLLTPLGEVVSSRDFPTALRIAVTATLRQIGGRQWISQLVLVAADGENDDNLRLVALKTLGEFDQTAYGEKILPLLKDENHLIRKAAGVVVGRSTLSAEKRTGIFIAK